MCTTKLIAPAAAALILSTAVPASAYVGPGAGAGTIAVVLGILAAVAMAFFGLLWYPIKRMLKKRQNVPETTRAEATQKPDGGE